MEQIRQERAARRNAWVLERQRLDDQDRRIANARGLCALTFGLVLWLAYSPELVPPALAWLPVGLFGVLVFVHGGVLAGLRRADRAIALYDLELARLDGTWVGRGDDGAALAQAGHPYQADLDLLGRGSLFQLVSSARTQAGREALAALLSAPASAEQARARQQAVRELCPRLDLRERLALAGDEVSSELSLGALRAWVERPVHPIPLASAVGWAVVGIGALGAVGLWLAGLVSPLVALASVALAYGVGRRAQPHVVRASLGLHGAERQLRLLAELLRVCEAERFSAPLLVAKGRQLGQGGRLASARIEALSRLVVIDSYRHNQLLFPFALVGLLGPQMARLIERWRQVDGPLVLDWIGALAELEALSSLAGYAALRSAGADGGDVWPEIVEDAAPLFEAEALGHPLLPRERCVCNDVALGGGGGAPRLLVISGSNMSGKSTFLRTLGLGAVLALAGAPVRARRLRLSALQLGTSLRISDSLADGVSRFFAEVQRLALLDELGRRGAPPLLFLVDEILSGTNSHDRVVGATAVVEGLLEHGAVGLLTTHDLALTRLVEPLGPQGANAHFQDADPDEGSAPGSGPGLRFDYRLRPGPIDPARSSALSLMRRAGLRV